ncbi:MAG: hypothetical protein HQL63_04415 [Magnetococcales bacterium]|nr:hypothetical protein [Magnetococcales bacterium]MBF0321740.1 hypothetical protein [Magnetococcales bacterium]
MNRREFLSRLALWYGTPWALAFLQGCATGKDSFPQGVRHLHGDVRFNGQPVHKGSVPQLDGVVTTGASSSLALVLGEDAFLIRENSTLELASLPAGSVVHPATVTTGPRFSIADMVRGHGGIPFISSAEAGPKAGDPDNHVKPSASAATADMHRLIGFTLKRGAVLSAFASGPHLIKTPIAMIGVRGTGLYLDHASDRSYVCTCYGQVVLSSIGEPHVREEIKTRHHDSPYTLRHSGSHTPTIEKAQMIDHTDDELIMLEGLVGRIPPFVSSQTITGGRYRY